MLPHSTAWGVGEGSGGRRPLLWVFCAIFLASCVAPQEASTGSYERSSNSRSSRKRTPAHPPKQMRVRTTAYTHTEPGGSKNAIGSRLRFGSDVSSAASDWSWIPVGTRFRIRETGRIYVVEDYGSALVGRETIDLYMPSARLMSAWGVREVTIEILEWGSTAMSRMLLEPRRGAPYINRMLAMMP